MTTLIQDLRYALRQLRKTRGSTATVMLTLALGIGANAAIFTLVNSVLLKSLPVAAPKTLWRLGDRNDCCVGTNGLNEAGDYSSFLRRRTNCSRKMCRSLRSWRRCRRGLPTGQ
jgi:macrolide transport system ATP-binding/permease protein